MRDPRKDPRPGDVLRRFGTTQIVAEIIKNTRGTTTHVVTDSDATKTISAWRSWAKESCEVLWQAPEEE